MPHLINFDMSNFLFYSVQKINNFLCGFFFDPLVLYQNAKFLSILPIHYQFSIVSNINLGLSWIYFLFFLFLILSLLFLLLFRWQKILPMYWITLTLYISWKVSWVCVSSYLCIASKCFKTFFTMKVSKFPEK